MNFEAIGELTGWSFDNLEYYDTPVQVVLKGLYHVEISSKKTVVTFYDRYKGTKRTWKTLWLVKTPTYFYEMKEYIVDTVKVVDGKEYITKIYNCDDF